MNMDNFAKQLLESHNRFRELHQAPPLVYDQSLADAAQKWANSLAQGDKLESDTACRTEMGENVAMKFCSTKRDFPGSDFTDYWYSPVAAYDFSGSTEVQPGSTVLSFTQLAWKSSAKIGVGKATSKSGKVYVVARYSPGGNCRGQFAENVLPTRDGKLPEFVLAKRAAEGNAKSVPKSDLRPVIGGKNPEDVLIDATTTEQIEGFKKIVTLVEKYQAADGTTYTREKQRVYTGALRK